MRRVFAAAASIALLLAGHALAQEGGLRPAAKPVPADATLGAAGKDRSGDDMALQRQLRATFGALPDYADVFVSVRGGVVTLNGRVLDVAAVERATELAARTPGVAAVNNAITIRSGFTERLAPAWERVNNRLAFALGLLPLLLLGFLVFVIVAAIGWGIARLPLWDRIAPNRFICDLLRQIVRIAFAVTGLLMALDVAGAAALIGTVLGAAGIVGLAVGFAVRDTVENYIASILLSFRQPFRPRDFVSIAGQDGFVVALTSRATVLLTLDGNHARIPNATVFKGTILNYSRHPERRFSFAVHASRPDLRAAVEAGIETMAALPFVLDDPPPDGWIENVYRDLAILRFVGWVDQRETHLAKAQGEAMRRVRLAVDPPREAETGVDDLDEEDTAASHDMEELVDSERDAAKGDLLDEGARQELGQAPHPRALREPGSEVKEP